MFICFLLFIGLYMPPMVSIVYIYVGEGVVDSVTPPPPPTCAASVYFRTDDNKYVILSLRLYASHGVGVCPHCVFPPVTDHWHLVYNYYFTFACIILVWLHTGLLYAAYSVRIVVFSLLQTLSVTMYRRYCLRFEAGRVVRLKSTPPPPSPPWYLCSSSHLLLFVASWLPLDTAALMDRLVVLSRQGVCYFPAPPSSWADKYIPSIYISSLV